MDPDGDREWDGGTDERARWGGAMFASRWVQATALCAAAVLLAGCSGANAKPEASPSAPSPTVQATPSSDRQCLRSQRQALPRLIRAWWQTGDNVEAGGRRVAVELWHSGIDSYLGTARSAGCPPVPREAVDVVRTDPLSAADPGWASVNARLQPADVRAMRHALRSLARKIGVRARVRHMTDAPLTCAEMQRAATVTYHVRRKPTVHGERLSLVVRVHNTSSRLLLGSTSGRLHVSEVLPGTPPTLDWGASMADDLWAKPGVIERKIVSGVTWHHLSIPTSATITELKVRAYLGYGYGSLQGGYGDPLSCDMHVTRR